MTGDETANPAGVEDGCKENRFSPSPAAWRNQATLRHPERSTYRCFLTDLAGFIDVCRAGPDYAKRQDRKKTGLFHSSLSSYSTLKTGRSSGYNQLSRMDHLHFTPTEEICQERYLPTSRLYFSLASAGILLRSVRMAAARA